MSTCNQLDLQTLGSQPITPKNLPDHWLGWWPLDTFFWGSHNFTVTALGSCVKWPLGFINLEVSGFLQKVPADKVVRIDLVIHVRHPESKFPAGHLLNYHLILCMAAT